jgi:hypothetical protein
MSHSKLERFRRSAHREFQPVLPKKASFNCLVARIDKAISVVKDISAAASRNLSNHSNQMMGDYVGGACVF